MYFRDYVRTLTTIHSKMSPFDDNDSSLDKFIDVKVIFFLFQRNSPISEICLEYITFLFVSIIKKKSTPPHREQDQEKTDGESRWIRVLSPSYSYNSVRINKHFLHFSYIFRFAFVTVLRYSQIVLRLKERSNTPLSTNHFPPFSLLWTLHNI